MMVDLEIRMDDRPGELARMGRALGRAGVSVEGGGMFLAGGAGVAHFLVDDETTAVATLRAEGLTVTNRRTPLTVRLDQDRPGQLGAFTGALAEADVNIEVLYSDHAGRLILLVDDMAAAEPVCTDWGR